MKIKRLFWMIMVTFTLPLAAQTESGVFAPFVSRMTAQVEGHYINLRWIDSHDIQGPVYIYRSTEPFLGPSPALGDILAVIPFGVGSFSEEIGTDGIYYYFAVASDLGDRRFTFPIPDTNTIGVGIGVEIPRAYHQDDWQVDPHFSWEETYYTESLLMPPRMAPVYILPRAFARDLQAFQYSGDDHALSTIVRNNFSVRDWEAAKNELFLFLSVPRSDETRDRARFYLGQCMYYVHQPREALFEFLTILDRFPIEISEWIQASYDMINFYYPEY